MGSFDPALVPNSHERELSIERLAKIDGIARKTAEAMYDIGIHTYVDLAQYLHHHTAEEVSAALKEYGLNRPPGFIKLEAWTRQAEIFSQSEKNISPSPEAQSDPMNNPEEITPSRESQEHDAVFTVSFDVTKGENNQPLLRTTVYDEKNAGTEKIFMGSDSSQWINWIFERANLPIALTPIESAIKENEELPHDETKAVGSPSLIEPYDAQIKISSFELIEIKRSPTDLEKKLQAEISFHLSGPHSARLASQGIPYRIEISTIKYGSSIHNLVAFHDDQLEPDQFEYKYPLEFTMPTVGRYEFHSLIILLPSGMLRAYHKGPIMKIIP